MTTAIMAGGCDTSSANYYELKRDAQRRFEMADKDGDSSVSLEEFQQALNRQGIGDTKAANIYSRLDSDGDGSFSQQEHDEAMQDRIRKIIRSQDDVRDIQPVSEKQSQLSAFKATLTSISENSSDPKTTGRINALLEKLETYGYSRENVDGSVAVVNEVAPAINTTA